MNFFLYILKHPKKNLQVILRKMTFSSKKMTSIEFNIRTQHKAPKDKTHYYQYRLHIDKLTN